MSRLPIEVQRIGAADLPAMREALQVFADAFDEEDTFFTAPPSDAYVQDLLSDDRFIMLTASEGGRVIGALSAYELRKYERERSELYIYDLAVAESHRRRGAATALIEALKPIALEKGAWMIFVQADREDEPAVALYRKLGVEEQPLHFDISPE